VEKVDRWLGSRLKDIQAFIDTVYRQDPHAKRVASLAGATPGVMASASLAVAMIGQGLAQARGLVTKHAVKQVDRRLSKQGGRRLGQLRPLGAAPGRRAQGDRRCDGLDGLRP
jgi:hypothetical protein